MKKIIAILVAIIFTTCIFTSCTKTKVLITPENFEQYFVISVEAELEGEEPKTFGDLLKPCTANVIVSIVPKQEISSSNNIYVVLEDMDNMIGWDCEYSIKMALTDDLTVSRGLRIPIQVSPNQISTKTFKMTKSDTEEPNIELEVVEAYGTIEI